MYINKLKIDENILVFDKDKKIVFIKDEEHLSSIYSAFKDIFCTRYISVDCNYVSECDLYCECEKKGIDFFITVKTKKEKQFEQEDMVGLCGNFEITCKYKPKENWTDVRRRMLRLVKADFQAFLFNDLSADMAFYFPKGCLYYLENVLYDDDIKRHNAESVVEDFINNLDYIYFDEYKLGFDKRARELKVSEAGFISDMRPDGVAKKNEDNLTKRQWDIVFLWEYIIANKLNEKLQTFYGENDKAPLFIENAFEDMNEDDIKTFMREIRALNRQTFIIEKHDNVFLESLCDDKKIVLNNDKKIVLNNHLENDVY